jgi:hypothetical protein
LEQLCKHLSDSETADVQASEGSRFGFLSSIASTSSVSKTSSSLSQSQQTDQQDPIDICFIVLRGKELRLVIYAVLQSTGEPLRASCLRLLSGNALECREGTFTYSLCELQQGDSVVAQDLVADELPNLKLALKTDDYETFLGGWRSIGHYPRKFR